MLRHQQTAKICLQQQQQDVDCVQPTKFQCKYCNKEYIRSDHYLRHEERCGKPIKKKPRGRPRKNTKEPDMMQMMAKVIDQYGDLITMLKTQDRKKPSITDTLQPITDKDLADYLDSLSLDFIQRGVQGYADYAGNYPFKGKIICTDRARKKIQYKNEDGTITADGKALAQRFFQAIAEKNSDIINKEYTALHLKLQTIVAAGNAGDEDVSHILQRASFIQDMLIKTQNAAQGKDDDFTQSFLAHLSKFAAK